VSGPRPILFGKLPRHGDFVARNLDAAAREAWDQWASRGLQQARAILGDRFEAEHDAAPAWRFVGAPGVFGPGWRAGAMAPSIDAAGRRFVIILAVEGLSAEQAAGGGEMIAEAMEELIYQAFEAGWDADTLVASAALTPPEGDGAGAASPRWWTLGGPEHPPASFAGHPDDLLAHAFSPVASEVGHER
jgi:type VI secretion system ImpM family protein